MRPFKNIAEFVEKTGFNVGMVIKTRLTSHKECESVSVITNFDCYANQMYFGEGFHPFADLFKSYEYFKDGKWLRFGVEESNGRPAKFKVGKEYFYFNDDDWAVHVFVNAKYRDPADNKVKIVFENTNPREVYTDENGNEYIALYENAINAENAAKYEVNAEDEVGE